MTGVHFCDELDFGFGWIADEPALLERCSHAVLADGSVWLFDPVEGEGVEERVRALGEVAGVVQLLDRHSRDSAPLALRFRVPLHRVPLVHVPDSPFKPVVVIRNRYWTEIAIWWQEHQVLICADAVGTASYYRARRERLAVHPLLRLIPPSRLGGLEPAHVLCGHGEGVHDEAADALHDAIARSGRRLPSWLLGRGGDAVRQLASLRRNAPLR